MGPFNLRQVLESLHFLMAPSYLIHSHSEPYIFLSSTLRQILMLSRLGIYYCVLAGNIIICYYTWNIRNFLSVTRNCWTNICLESRFDVVEINCNDIL